MPSHTKRRGAVYYTRMVVPPRLRSIIGKSDLGRSLGTADYRDAVRLQPIWLAEALATIDAAEAELARQLAAPSPAAPPVIGSIAAMSFEEFERWQEHQAEEFRRSSAEDDAEQMMDKPEAQLAPIEAAAARLLRSARKERDGYRSRYHSRKRRDRERGGAGPGELRSGSPVTISGMFEGYASQPGSRQSTVKQFRAIINHLVAFVGHDDAKRISHADLVRWREHLRTEPIAKPKT